jgi:ADP-heptose:LPS heptosyltransferase
MKIIGFNGGQYGDLAINMIAAKAIKIQYPNCHFTMGISQKYSGIAPVFYHNPLIDDIHIWEGYDNWPTQNDNKFITNNNFDKVYSVNPKVTDETWYLRRHHSQEVCRMHGLTPPDDLQVDLVKYFNLLPEYKDCIAIAPFTSAGSPRDIDKELCIDIINYIHSLGFKTIQLGVKAHEQLPTTYQIPNGTIFNDVVIALSCRMLITADTGINYLVSGYKHKVIGLYSTNCYPIKPPLINRRPVNINGYYLEGESTKHIIVSEIFTLINKLL